MAVLAAAAATSFVSKVLLRTVCHLQVEEEKRLARNLGVYSGFDM